MPTLPRSNLQPLNWDEGEPWRLWLEVRQGEGEQWSIEGSLRRGEERMELAQPLLLLESGLMIMPGRVARFDPAGAFPWVAKLQTLKRISFRDRERDKVLERLLECAVVPPLELDEALQFEERRVAPRLGLRVTQQRNPWARSIFKRISCWTTGRDGSRTASAGSGVWLREERVYLVRDVEAENAARENAERPGTEARLT